MPYQYKDGIDYTSADLDVDFDYGDNGIICSINGYFMPRNVDIEKTMDNISKKCPSAVYTDRLYQWDHKKYDALRKKHFNDISQYWSGANPSTVSAFLSDYFGKPVKVQAIAHQENRSNGYPVWIIWYKET